MVRRSGKGFWASRLLAGLTVLALLLSACGGGSTQQAPAQTAPAQQSGGQAAQPAPVAANFKMAMILPRTVEDSDYNFVGYEALFQLRETYGIEFKYQERVAPADAERAARGFINDGYNIVAFHGGQFVTAVKKLAPQFPEVNFIVESGGEIPDLPENVWNIGRKFYEGFYSLGTLAALTSKSGKIGVIAGIKLPDFVAAINAIKEAVRTVNPQAEVVYAFVGDQNDPVAARQAAEAQINSGADFLIMIVNLGAFGVIEAAKDKPVLLTTYYTDKIQLAPKNFAGSLLTDFGVPYKNVVGKIIEGTRGGYEEMRPGNGMSLSGLNNVSADVAKQVQETFEQVVQRQIKLVEKTDAIAD